MLQGILGGKGRVQPLPLAPAFSLLVVSKLPLLPWIEVPGICTSLLKLTLLRLVRVCVRCGARTAFTEAAEKPVVIRATGFLPTVPHGGVELLFLDGAVEQFCVALLIFQLERRERVLIGDDGVVAWGGLVSFGDWPSWGLGALRTFVSAGNGCISGGRDRLKLRSVMGS